MRDRSIGHNKDTPIIAWTSTESNQQSCIENGMRFACISPIHHTCTGMNFVLLKPFNKEQFMSALDTWSVTKVENLALDADLELLDLDWDAPLDLLVSDLVKPVGQHCNTCMTDCGWDGWH